jgi:glycine/D-amino acid oxidase-like deaminating enzyme
MLFSYWEKKSFIKEPDVVIIGSGIVGLNAALSLKKKSPSLNILILERGILPYGASTKNAGFACYGSASELLEDLNYSTEEEVFSLVEKRWKGLQKLRKIIGDENMNFEEFGGFELFTSDDNVLYDECLSKLDLLNKQLFNITGERSMYVNADDRISSFGFKNVRHLLMNKKEAQIDTGRMMKALLDLARNSGIEILNGVDVKNIEEKNNSVNISFSAGTSYELEIIASRKVLICVNGFAKKFLPGENIEAARSQVIVTSPIEDLKIKGTFHYDHGYYYFRNIENRILFGGGRNLDFENEFTEEFGLTEIIQSRLDDLLKKMILPEKDFQVEMRWSGIMGLGKVKKPIIKKTGENIFCAVRMGGMGIAIGSLVGEEAAELLLNHL